MQGRIRTLSGWILLATCWAPQVWAEPMEEVEGIALSGHHGGCQSCGACRPSCAPCAPCYSTPAGFVAGYEHTIMKPYFSQGFNAPTDGTVFTELPASATFDYASAPRAWVGYVGCNGRGFRARWWGFDQAGNDGIVADFPEEDFDMVTEGALNVQEVDIEATQAAHFCSWLFNLSGGVRLAHVSQTSNVSFVETPVPETVIEVFENRQRFNGVGPTLAIEAIRPMGDSSFALFGNGRCSLVFGNSDSEGFTTDEQLIEVPFEFDNDAFMSIWELQAGVQWSRAVGRGARLFVRGALEAQVWQNAGNLFTTDSDLGFFGFAIGVGLNR